MFTFIDSGKGYLFALENPTIRADKNGDVYGGGGTKTSIQQAPTTPAPSAAESARDIYQARLQYDPSVAAMEMGLAQQYYPQQAQLAAALYGQYAPQIAQTQQALRQQVMPEQQRLIDVMTQQAIERMESPYAYTPEEQEAITGIRGRAEEELTRAMRTRANIGGGLFGGRAAGMEERAISEMQQAFAGEDIGRRLQAGQYAQQAALPIAQIMYPQMQYPGMPPTQQVPQVSAVPSADQLYAAMAQAQQPQYFAQQGQPSPMWELAGSLGGAATMGLMMSDIRLKKNIKKIGKLGRFNLYIWEWKDSVKKYIKNMPTIGVIAQEVLKIKPQAIFKDNNGFLGVNYNLI